MKINLKLLGSCLLAAFTVCAQAQVTLVKQDGDKLYLDISSLNRNVQTGETFKIITSSETLTNPKTGKNLGLIYHYSNPGVITEVHDLYAVGELKNAPAFTVGQEAALEPSAAPVQAAVQPAGKPQNGATRTAPARGLTRYTPVEQTIISLTQADINGDGTEEIVTLSEKGVVTVWRAETERLLPLYTWQLKHKEGVTLSAADVKQTGRAQIFLTAYDARRQAVSASVLELKDNALQETDTLPYFVKELGCGADKKIWVQRAFVIGSNPGVAHPLTYDGKRFQTGDERLNTQRNWLTGVNAFPLENKDEANLIYTSSNGRIRLILANGKRAESKDLFASTPNRVKYKQDIVKFYPSVQAYQTQDGAAVAAVENVTKTGLLSDTFGSYQNANIHFMQFEKGRLSVTDSTALDGYVYDTACTARGVLTAEILPDGNSAVVEIFK